MTDDDARRVRRTARSIGLSVGIASAVIIAAGVGILVALILTTSRTEGDEHGGSMPPGERPGDHLVVDVDRMLPAVLILGVIGVLLLGLVAWFAARRSVAPLGAALRQQRHFVADASHELRTPLTTLSSRIQVLQRRHGKGEPIDETIGELRRDAAMMADVLGDLLLAAEEGAAPANEPTSAVGAAQTVAASLAAIAAEADVTVEVRAAQDVGVALASVTLVRVILALTDNAVQHAPAGSTVTITVERATDAAEIRVTDQGSGIVGIAADRVFERFARSAESGRRRGFGLGLSLARDVALRAGGDVSVEHTSTAGTTFLLRLPVA
jgi:signal transduction histidine kinase